MKEQVYLPDWLDPERLAYTDRLADILAALVPEGVEGTISTVPGAFAPRVHGDADQARMARAMLDHVAHLVRLRARHGPARRARPRAGAVLLPRDDRRDGRLLRAAPLLARGGGARSRTTTGLARADAEQAIREHLGVCLDACHLAVEFEDPAQVLDALARARASACRRCR